jgi:hypothetical protein
MLNEKNKNYNDVQVDNPDIHIPLLWLDLTTSLV